jgi:hypothetical protein
MKGWPFDTAYVRQCESGAKAVRRQAYGSAPLGASLFLKWYAVEFQLVACQTVSQSLGDFLLQGFDLGVHKFDHFARV